MPAHSRGNMLNIELKLPNKRVIDISLPESSKVTDIFTIAEEASGLKFPPKDCSLFWKGSRLGHKMTLDYYRIPNRGKIELTRKLGGLSSDSVSNTATPRKGDKKNPLPDDLVIPNSPNHLLRQQAGANGGRVGSVNNSIIVDPHHNQPFDNQSPYGDVPSYQGTPTYGQGIPPYSGYPWSMQPPLGGQPSRYVDDRLRSDDIYVAPPYHSVATTPASYYPQAQQSTGRLHGSLEGGTADLAGRLPTLYQPSAAPPAGPPYDPFPHYNTLPSRDPATIPRYQSPTREAPRPPSAVAYNPMNMSLNYPPPPQRYSSPTHYTTASSYPTASYHPNPISYIGGNSSGVFEAPRPQPRPYETALGAAAYPSVPPTDYSMPLQKSTSMATYNRNPSTTSLRKISSNDPHPRISDETIKSRILQEESRQVVRELERNVQNNTSQYNAALDRIAQLETTVLRLQTIAERAVSGTENSTSRRSMGALPPGGVAPLGVPSYQTSGAPLRY